MASIVETKAVALRRGNHAENLAFTGVKGEVVVDLGYPDSAGTLGTDANTTLRLHNGITKGGIPMARADLLNVSTDDLTQGRQYVNEKNLACADLSNLEKTPNELYRERIVSTLNEYGLAKESEIGEQLNDKVNLKTDNLNTKQLVDPIIHNGGEEGNLPLAYANTSNINTADLVNTTYRDGVDGNKPLAYKDLSNVDTTNLTLSEEERPDQMSGPILANADGSNINTNGLTGERNVDLYGKPLMYADMSNANDEAFSAMLNDSSLNIERSTNKDFIIDENNLQLGHYPTTEAVVNYIGSVDNAANRYLTNINDWSMLFYGSDEQILKYGGDVTENAVSEFHKGDSFITDVLLLKDSKGPLEVTVEQIDESGAILALSLDRQFGSKDLSTTPLSITSNTNAVAQFTLNCEDKGNGIYKYSIGTIENAGAGFVLDESYTVKDINETIYQQVRIVIKEVVENKVTRVEVTPPYGLTQITDEVVTLTDETNGTSTKIKLKADKYNENGGAGALKNDLTNLQGMTNEDKIAETDSPWRIRHDEDIPALSLSTIPESQNYTLATNAAVWRALKGQNNPSVFSVARTSAKTQSVVSATPDFVVNYSANGKVLNEKITLSTMYNDTISVNVNPYAENSAQGVMIYNVRPNKSYVCSISHGGEDVPETYSFETEADGADVTLECKAVTTKFKVNVEGAQITYSSESSENETTKPFDGKTFELTRILNTNWKISADGYSPKFGTINTATATDETIVVELK